VWERARDHALYGRCRRLARAQSLLTSDPGAAEQLAKGLERSDLAQPARVVVARAELALGHGAVAWKIFQALLADSPDALSEPVARHDGARAAALAGEHALSAMIYRAVVSERELLPPARQTALMLEAAAAVLRLGPENAAEALGYLDLVSLRPALTGARELALSAWLRARAADPMAANPVATSGLSCPLPSVKDPGSAYEVRLPEFEGHALLAIACEGSDRATAVTHWGVYSQASEARPWLAWVKTRLEGLR
jgi:hypothetical protein